MNYQAQSVIHTQQLCPFYVGNMFDIICIENFILEITIRTFVAYLFLHTGKSNHIWSGLRLVAEDFTLERSFGEYWPDPFELTSRRVGFGTTDKLHMFLTHVPIFVKSYYWHHWCNCKRKYDKKICQNTLFLRLLFFYIIQQQRLVLPAWIIEMKSNFIYFIR